MGRTPPGSSAPRRRHAAADVPSCCGPLSCLPEKGFRHWASTRSVSRPSRRSATGPPGSYPDPDLHRQATTSLSLSAQLYGITSNSLDARMIGASHLGEMSRYVHAESAFGYPQGAGRGRLAPASGPSAITPPEPMLLWILSTPSEGISGVRTADRPMMGHSLKRASSYQVTRLREIGKRGPWTGISGSGQSRGTTGVR